MKKCREPQRIPGFVPIKTALYEVAERVLREKVPEPLKRYNEENPSNTFVETDEEALLRSDLSGILFEDREFREELERNLRRCRRKFGRASHSARYHLRSSTTVEDFVDDRYYGTFETLQRRESFNKQKRGQKLPLVHDVIELVKWFYAMKHHTDDFFLNWILETLLEWCL